MEDAEHVSLQLQVFGGNVMLMGVVLALAVEGQIIDECLKGECRSMGEVEI